MRTRGVVTATAGNGFYVQDPVGDGDPATSDALFVFTGGAPGLSVGDQVELTGEVSEFTPGGTVTRNLSTTQMAFPQVRVTGTAALPEAVRIGQGGRLPPAANIDDDAFAGFEPDSDGIDFFESLEAMRVRVTAPLAVAPTNRFNEIFTVADGGAGASGLSSRLTLNIAPDDFNPERIQIDFDSAILPGFAFPSVDTGSILTDVIGVIGFDFGNFQVHPTEAFGVSPGGLAPASSSIRGGDSRLTLASYNVLNLDPQVERIERVVNQDSDEIDDDVGLGRFDAIATQIVNALDAPDIIALQEIQDNDGAEVSEVAAADLTLQTLVDAIERAGGPSYRFLDTPGLVPAFTTNDGVVSPVGGQPGQPRHQRKAQQEPAGRPEEIGDARAAVGKHRQPRRAFGEIGHQRRQTQPRAIGQAHDQDRQRLQRHRHRDHRHAHLRRQRDEQAAARHQHQLLQES